MGTASHAAEGTASHAAEGTASLAAEKLYRMGNKRQGTTSVVPIKPIE
jgi:hypothetical protein